MIVHMYTCNIVIDFAYVHRNAIAGIAYLQGQVCNIIIGIACVQV